MNEVTRFYDAIKKDMAMTLATAAGGSVTMRTVSPVFYKNHILIFTARDSQKYRQLAENPNCCIGAGGFFAQATAEFCGKTMSDENSELRTVYSSKFPGAFEEGISFGGRNAEFILLKPFQLTGWAFENDIPTDDGIPTIPFEITLD